MRYVGEPIAVVFADNAYLAEDAADLVEIEVEQRRAILLATEQPGVYEHEHSTNAGVVQKAYGDVEKPLRTRTPLFRLSFPSAATPACRWRRAAPSPATTKRSDILEMHGAAKVPHWNRDQIARMLGRPRNSVQLYEGHVGGGFGIRGEIYPEDVLVCAAALKFRRPIKWIEDRREHLIAANHSRQQRHQISAAIDYRRPHPRHRRRVLPRQRRLYAHARRDRARSCRGDAARPLSRAGLSCDRPHPSHQQDAVRHLPRARPLRDFVRARAAARRHRGESRHRQGGGAPAQSDRQKRHALRARPRHARHAYHLRFRRLCRPARQGAAPC